MGPHGATIGARFKLPLAARPTGGSFPLLASRSCPEFCTYCPHRILTTYRARSVGNILDELSHLASEERRPYVVFRDPLFTQDRERVLELCDGIESRGLDLTFECETRLDRLDAELLTTMHRAGLRAMSFGVEAVSAITLKKVGRRPIPETHQRAIVAKCRQLGIVTAAFYVFGFLEDTRESITATIEYAAELGSTVAQFKILTPYPGTPLFKRMEPLLTVQDWERYDGFTPTFNHPNLTQDQLKYLLGAAYTRFYMRPSYVANYLRITDAEGSRLRRTARRARHASARAPGERGYLEARVMLTAISRYGARVLPMTQELIAEIEGRGTFIEGPQIAEFERAFAARLGGVRAVSASYGRMAFYYILQALNFPPGSEIVVPALTFWVIPEIARVAGLTPVFADVDPDDVQRHAGDGRACHHAEDRRGRARRTCGACRATWTASSRSRISTSSS